ncbi:hypothetical protein [Plesiocystis pacifica]|uniref:hypothetical protein n=1 Tax=Plesiocystis pacifica TaxID=191768 RepID=UPI0012F80DD5|nr:hypothetical protein [Plesiocystis pacifica]
MADCERRGRGRDGQAPRRGRRAIAAALTALGLGGLLVTTACVEHALLVPAPTLRGITIPLPPPSFADEVLLTIDIEGVVPDGFSGEGTQAFLFEKGTSRGYFVLTEGPVYNFYDVLVDIEDNCLETWFVDGVDGQESSVIDYKVELREGEEACGDPDCSAPDEMGACLCLEKWTVGC